MKKIFLLGTLFLSNFMALLFYQNMTPLATQVDSAVCPTQFGANFNTDPTTLRSFLIDDRLKMSWFRAIIDVFEIKQALDLPATHKNKALRMQQVQDKFDAFAKAKRVFKLRTIASLKFDYIKDSQRLPLANSPEEKEIRKVVKFIIDAIKDDLDVIVSGNEPIVESLKSDFNFENSLQRSRLDLFYVRMTHFVDASLGSASPVKLFVGSFNRLDVPQKRDYYGVQRLLNFALENPIVDGVDLHVHVPSMEAFKSQLEYVREKIDAAGTNKQLLVTEFSLMWLFKKHLADNLCESDLESQFCNHVRSLPFFKDIFSRGTLVRELDFINAMLNAPNDKKLSQDLFKEYFTSRSYLQFDFIRESYSLFSQYGVTIASYNFDQDDVNDPTTWQWNKNYTLDDTTPRLYALYSPQTALRVNVIPVNEYLYHPFKRIVDLVNETYHSSHHKMRYCEFAPLPQ